MILRHKIANKTETVKLSNWSQISDTHFMNIFRSRITMNTPNTDNNFAASCGARGKVGSWKGDERRCIKIYGGEFELGREVAWGNKVQVLSPN